MKKEKFVLVHTRDGRCYVNATFCDLYQRLSHPERRRLRLKNGLWATVIRLTCITEDALGIPEIVAMHHWHFLVKINFPEEPVYLVFNGGERRGDLERLAKRLKRGQDEAINHALFALYGKTICKLTDAFGTFIVDSINKGISPGISALISEECPKV